jgi:hypothetical protein
MGSLRDGSKGKMDGVSGARTGETSVINAGARGSSSMAGIVVEGVSEGKMSKEASK